VKESFYEELERVFDKFPKYHTKMLLGDFNAKVGKENLFKPTIVKGSTRTEVHRRVWSPNILKFVQNFPVER
jgi:hypothetical protein